MTFGTFSNLNLNRLLSLSASGTSIFLIDSLPFLKPFGVKQVLTLKPIIYLPYLSRQTDFPLCTLDICGFHGNFIVGSSLKRAQTNLRSAAVKIELKLS